MHPTIAQILLFFNTLPEKNQIRRILLYKTLPPVQKVRVQPRDVCDGALPGRNRRASFVSYSRMKGTITLHVHGLMVGCGQHNTHLQQKLFRWLSNASGPLLVPLIPFTKRSLSPSTILSVCYILFLSRHECLSCSFSLL